MTTVEKIKKLSDQQVEAFNTEYVHDELWDTLVMELNQTNLTEPDVSFLDVGGGNGVFTDRILKRYPNSHGYLLDNSQFLLGVNSQHPRKKLIEASAENLTEVFSDKKFDVIFMNWFLHHAVKSTFSDTLTSQREILAMAHALLKKDGKLIVFENLPDGWLGETLCSYVINRVTSNRFIAPFVKKMGGNTAGIGICFLGEKQWNKQFNLSGFSVFTMNKFKHWHLNPIKKALLTIKNVRVALYVLNKRDHKIY